MFGLFKASPGFVFLVDTAGNVSAAAAGRWSSGMGGRRRIEKSRR